MARGMLDKDSDAKLLTDYRVLQIEIDNPETPYTKWMTAHRKQRIISLEWHIRHGRYLDD